MTDELYQQLREVARRSNMSREGMRVVQDILGTPSFHTVIDEGYVEDTPPMPPQTVHPEDTIGMIAEHDSPPPIYSQINPRSNFYSYVVHNTVKPAYTTCDLPNIPWVESEPNPKEDINMSEKRQWLPEDFPFAGTIVMLNPENVRNYEQIVAKHGDKLVVVNHEADEQTLHTVLTRGNDHMPHWTVRCNFLKDGYSCAYDAQQIIFLEEPHEVVERITLSNGNDYYRHKYISASKKENLDHDIIVRGRSISRVETFDVDFRNKAISDAYLVLNDRAQREEARRPKPKRPSRPAFTEPDVEEIDLGGLTEGDDSEF